MKQVHHSGPAYLLLTGLHPRTPIKLNSYVELFAADTSHLDFNTAVKTCSHPDDIAVVAAFIPRVTAQFRVVGKSAKELAINVWNAQWDALFLGAIFNTEVSFNLQSDTEANNISATSSLRATNLKMYGVSNSSPHQITESENIWLELHFEKATRLLDRDPFRNAVHCLASYRWHSMPFAQMAVLWAGIEGLFGIDSELRFRLSLWISQFLPSDSKEARKTTFDKVKKLYDARSKAVHGGVMKEVSSVQESAELLQTLLKVCVEYDALPDENEMFP